MEWVELAANGPLIVAGDFNQHRDGSGWYGTSEGRALLTSALDGAGLRCLTEDDIVATGRLTSNHLVDHICATADLADRSGRVECWEPTNEDGVRMSDHPGVAIRLSLR